MRRIGSKPKKKKMETPVPTVKPTPKVDVAAKAQVEATLALTEIAAEAINNPQLTQLINQLAQPKPDTPRTNKRLTINRDSNGLITSVDIEEL